MESRTDMTSTLEYGVRPPKYRLPDDTHLGRVRLQVADLDRSLAWYQSVLGMRVVSKTERGAQLGPEKGDAVLLELREKKGVRRVPHRGLLGLYHFALLLPDRAAL